MKSENENFLKKKKERETITILNWVKFLQRKEVESKKMRISSDNPI